jgi:hypothetical protein
LREIAVRTFPVRERQIDIWFTKTRPMRRGEERERRREKEERRREREGGEKESLLGGQEENNVTNFKGEK